MRLNWFGYWQQYDGYGRFNTRMIEALWGLGVEVCPIHIGDMDRPFRLLRDMPVNWNAPLNISCMAPYMLKRLQGRHWLFSMTEGSRIPPSWVDRIAEVGVERVIVPCQHNAIAFRESGVTVPISVVPGGTDPAEFPLLPAKESYRPYTFLTFADRGFRKGWDETRNAFYQAFGGKTTGNMDARLIIKARPQGKPILLDIMNSAQDKDPRVIYQVEDSDDMRQVFAQAHCLVLPSRCEGWGMIHREAASSGLPVITQQYAGMDDGHTSEWALVVEGDREEEIPREVASALGNWRIANFQDIAQKMLYCFYSPESAAAFGRRASEWIRKNQTWHHSAYKLAELIDQHTLKGFNLNGTTNGKNSQPATQATW